MARVRPSVRERVWSSAVLIVALVLGLVFTAQAIAGPLSSASVFAGAATTPARAHHYAAPPASTTRTAQHRAIALIGSPSARTVLRSSTSSAGRFLAAKGETKLYRAVSDDELKDVAANGFRPGPNSMETKLFATTAEDAARFGRASYGLDGKPFTLLEVGLPNPIASMLYRGSADSMAIRGLDPSHLGAFNRAARVRQLNSIPRGR